MKRVFSDTMIMLLVLLTVSLLLTGCAGWGAFKNGVSSYGARTSDETRIAAEWTLCKAMTVGAWRRAYGASPEKAEAWRVLCADDVKATP